MKNKFKHLILTFSIAIAIVSCHDDLDQSPIDPDSFTEQDVFANTDQAIGALAKLYASLTLTGQATTGQADISDIDEGASQFTRMLFNLNELTTDHAVCGWGDPGLPDLHGLYWSASNDFVQAMYVRLAQEVSFCNSFIDRASQLEGAEEFIAEARFLRAFAYYNLLDMYGNVPIVTEISTELPLQNSRMELFDFVESELLAIEGVLPASNDYGRVDQVAAWALLSRLYLNSETWTGTSRYDECITFSNQVIASNYSLNENDANGNGTAYDELFLADNNINGAEDEFIFVLTFDGVQSQTYGGSTFLIHAAIGGSMNASSFGVNGGWGGNRTTSALVEKFDGNDPRAMFYTDGQSLEIENISPFNQGYAITKFKNIKSDGTQGNDGTGEFADTDIPIIRLSEIYLNYAEATLRGGSGGSTSTALEYVNDIRMRAFGNTSGNISSGDLTLDFILDERSRELYWEGQRRTDLVRYGYFTGGAYLWPWKGNQQNGTSVSSFRSIFPIPSNNILTNPNLQQNPGY